MSRWLEMCIWLESGKRQRRVMIFERANLISTLVWRKFDV